MSEPHNPDGLTEAQREEIREIVNEEAGSGKMARRGFLGALGAAAGVGAMSGGAAGEISSSQQEPMSLGGSLDVDEAYQVAGNWYAGPESAKPTPDTDEPAFWTVTDAETGDVLRMDHWDGSQWSQTSWSMQDLHSESVDAGKVSADDAYILDGALSSDKNNPTEWSKRSNNAAVSQIQEVGKSVTADNTAQDLSAHSFGGLFTVRAARADGTNEAFYDTLTVSPKSSSIMGSTTWNTSIARSYSVGSGNLRVAIDGASNDWDVAVTAIAGVR